MAVVESTKARALGEARALLQTYGFNGFSFQDVADRIGIRKPSLYVHFKSKEELGCDLIAIYREEITAWARTVSVFSATDRIGAVFELFYSLSKEGGMFCPLNSLGAEFHTLPKAMQKALTQVVAEQREWIEHVIRAGQKSREFRKDLSSDALASTILSMAYGAQALARTQKDADAVRTVKNAALGLLRAT